MKYESLVNILLKACATFRPKRRSLPCKLIFGSLFVHALFHIFEYYTVIHLLMMERGMRLTRSESLKAIDLSPDDYAQPMGDRYTNT
jgi:hypothetical protein